MNNSIQTEVIRQGYGAALSEVYLLFQSRDLRNKVLVLVEGPDDKLVYSNVLKEDAVYLLPKNISFHQIVLSEVEKKFPTRIISLRDADFNNANLNPPPCASMFFTDAHDLETMICQNHCIGEIVGEEYNSYCDGIDIYQLSEILKDYSYMKWYNYNNHRNLAFKNLNTISLYEEGLLGQRDKLFVKVKGVSPNNTAKQEELDSFQNSHSIVEILSITNGHDLMDCVYCEIQKRKGGNLLKKKKKKTILSNYSVQLFCGTYLYSKLAQWCNNNNQNILRLPS